MRITNESKGPPQCDVVSLTREWEEIAEQLARSRHSAGLDKAVEPGRPDKQEPAVLPFPGMLRPLIRARTSDRGEGVFHLLCRCESLTPIGRAGLKQEFRQLPIHVGANCAWVDGMLTSHGL